MTRTKPPLVPGSARYRHTESDYLAVLLETVSLDDWRAIVSTAMDAAKNGDAGARVWLAQYLVGKPAAPAPAPLTVVVQQLAGRDPVVEQLVEPHVDRLKYPGLHADDRRIEAIRSRVTDELRAGEVVASETP